MNLLVIGSGGREHALVWRLKQSPATDLTQLLRFAKENAVDLTVVGPDDPLALGVVDRFASEGLRIFGPTKSAARLESSKIFAKDLMRAQDVPTAQARTFSDSEAALAYCEELKFPVVIKADGLALGKGVIIAENVASA